jgi:hypothetical protein
MWQCLECGSKVEDDAKVFCRCGTPKGGRREIRLDEQPRVTGSSRAEQTNPQVTGSSTERKVVLSELAIALPMLGVMMAGVELGYRRYRFGAFLLSLTFVQSLLALLLSLLFG